MYYNMNMMDMLLIRMKRNYMNQNDLFKDQINQGLSKGFSKAFLFK